MKKKFILLALWLTFIAGCSSDDDNPPSDFTIVVDTTAFDTATISWTKPEGATNENLSYSISLNNFTIAEELSELSYTFEGISVATSYEVEIMASNSFGNTTATTTFETLDPEDFSFFLKTVSNGQRVYTYDYNTNGYLVERTDNVTTGERHTYQYDENGNLSMERVNGFDFANSANFEYTGNVLNNVTAGVAFDSYDFDFQNINNYMITYQPDLDPNPLFYQVELERTENLITSYKRTNIQTQEVMGKLQFEYQEGNVTKIIDELNNDIYTINYDAKNNYILKQGYLTKSGPLGITIVDLYYQFLFIPDFITYRNINNITEIKKNGTIILEFAYEYNAFNYPKKIFVNESTQPDILIYTYF